MDSSCGVVLYRFIDVRKQNIELKTGKHLIKGITEKIIFITASTWAFKNL